MRHSDSGAIGMSQGQFCQMEVCVSRLAPQGPLAIYGIVVKECRKHWYMCSDMYFVKLNECLKFTDFGSLLICLWVWGSWFLGFLVFRIFRFLLVFHHIVFCFLQNDSYSKLFLTHSKRKYIIMLPNCKMFKFPNVMFTDKLKMFPQSFLFL